MTARGLARRFGMRVEFADLGDWGGALLCAEYEAPNAVARINQRLVAQLTGPGRERFVEFAIAHELYHHLCSRRPVRSRKSRAAAERAADAFAERLTSGRSGLLASFLRNTS